MSGVATYILVESWKQHTDSPSLFLKLISIFPVLVGYFSPSEEIGFILVTMVAFLQFFLLFTLAQMVGNEAFKFVSRRNILKSGKGK